MIDDLYDLIGEGARSGLPRNPSTIKSWKMIASATSSTAPTWRTFAPDRACSFPCFSAAELCIQAKIFMRLMRMRETTG